MALSEEQRREFDRLTIENVRLKLAHSAAEREAVVMLGLGDGTVLRADVENWLAKMARLEAEQRAATLRWAKIAGLASIALLTLSVLAMILGTALDRILDWVLGIH